jgi:DHA2 family methylenomycin A resistance protein-like MFS transporter
VLAIVALTTFIGAVIEFNALGASSHLVQGALLAALVSAVLFVRSQRRSAAPMLPLGLFRDIGFSGAVLFGVLVNFAYYGVIFVLSFHLQKVRGFSVMHAGLVFLPLTGTFIVSNIASGRMQARMGSRTPMIVGGLIGATGYALLGIFGISHDSTFLEMLPGLALIPAGMGLAVPAMTTSILSAVERSQAGTASAILNTARQVGGAMGVAIFGAMLDIGFALAISTALLLLGALLAWHCIKHPLSTKGASICRT